MNMLKIIKIFNKLIKNKSLLLLYIIVIMSNTMDPYKVLGVSYDADIQQIREQFKKLVLKAHPDRGGSERVFTLIKNAYKYLYEYKKKEQKQLENERRTLEQAKKERRRQSKKLKQEFKQVQNNPHLKKINANSKSFDSRSFNKLFNEFKSSDADDRGYDTMKSSKDRLDADDIRAQYERENRQKMQIAVIAEPEGLQAGSQPYKELGVKHVGDFSKRHEGNGQGFTDYQSAYTDREVLENTMGNTREDSHLGAKAGKQVNKLMNRRGRVKYDMNPQEKSQHEMKMKQERAMEEQRRFHFQQQKDNTSKSFQRMQNFITFR